MSRQLYGISARFKETIYVAALCHHIWFYWSPTLLLYRQSGLTRLINRSAHNQSQIFRKSLQIVSVPHRKQTRVICLVRVDSVDASGLDSCRYSCSGGVYGVLSRLASLSNRFGQKMRIKGGLSRHPLYILSGQSRQIPENLSL